MNFEFCKIFHMHDVLTLIVSVLGEHSGFSVLTLGCYINSSFRHRAA